MLQVNSTACFMNRFTFESTLAARIRLPVNYACVAARYDPISALRFAACRVCCLEWPKGWVKTCLATESTEPIEKKSHKSLWTLWLNTQLAIPLLSPCRGGVVAFFILYRFIQ